MSGLDTTAIGFVIKDTVCRVNVPSTRASSNADNRSFCAFANEFVFFDVAVSKGVNSGVYICLPTEMAFNVYPVVMISSIST
jgi:hypothetical protein